MVRKVTTRESMRGAINRAPAMPPSASYMSSRKSVRPLPDVSAPWHEETQLAARMGWMSWHQVGTGPASVEPEVPGALRTSQVRPARRDGPRHRCRAGGSRPRTRTTCR